MSHLDASPTNKLNIENILAHWGLHFPMETVKSMYRHAELVASWNRTRVNLTGAKTLSDILLHTVDSLAPLSIMELNWPPCANVLDIGTGAGFPGLILALCQPGWHVTLIESIGKKRQFLRSAVESLQLDDRVEILGERAEVLAHLPTRREAYDLVFGRALAQIPVALELVIPFVRRGGKGVFYLGGKSVGKVDESFIKKLGGNIKLIYKYNIKQLINNCYVFVVDKEGETPGIFPHRRLKSS